MARVARIASAVVARCRARLQGCRRGVRIGRGTRFGRGVRCAAAPNAQIVLGREVEIGARTTLTAFPSASLIVGDRVFVSGACTIAAAGHVSVGEESLIAEMVSIRDHDHDPAFPPRSGRTLRGDVRIGSRVWVGAKATVVRGVVIGDDVVVGAHALVNRYVPPGTLVVGVPAKPVRRNLRHDDPVIPGDTGDPDV